MEQITRIVNKFSEIPAMRVVLILAGAVLAAFIARFVFTKIIATLSSKTSTDIDDRIAAAVRKPIMYSLILAGIGWAVIDLELHGTINFVALGLVKTIAIIIWSMAAFRVGEILLEILSANVDRFEWIQPKTMPLFNMILKVSVVSGLLYFAFVAWNISVTSWLASAGIVGIAVGFAAKDTLANLFSGVFILADSPYKIGDFIVLDNGVRGIVTDIGIRSTRLVTRDDVQITLPNALISNSKIVNQTGGRHNKMRVRVNVFVAYGSDVDQVREVMLSCVQNADHVSDDPEPRVRFREFGDSGLRFELLVWIDEPIFRGRVLDNLNTRVYKAFMEKGIEIPYNKYDVYIKQGPGRNREEDLN